MRRRRDSSPPSRVCLCVCAGKLASATGADGTLLVRLEVNPQAGMCRVSVRSPSDPLHAAVAKIIASQLGTPA